MQGLPEAPLHPLLVIGHPQPHPFQSQSGTMAVADEIRCDVSLHAQAYGHASQTAQQPGLES